MKAEMQQFNTLVQLFDAITMFQYDRVGPQAILLFLRSKFGDRSNTALAFEESAKAVGYLNGEEK